MVPPPETPVTAPYRLRYSFDAGSGICLWSDNDAAREKFGDPVDLVDLPLPATVRRRGDFLMAWHDTFVNWDNPGAPSPWQTRESGAFKLAARDFVGLLRQNLGPDFELIDQAGAATADSGAASNGYVIETERLGLRRFTAGDEPFIVELLNDPGFLRYIGDRGVRTPADASRYILHGPVSSYERHGFGLYRVELRDGRIPVGICGLLKRDTLPDVDVGYAFLPQYRGLGYAYESVSAVMADARAAHGIDRLVAIVTPDNADSIKVLEKLGFAFERRLRLTDDADEISLYASNT